MPDYTDIDQHRTIDRRKNDFRYHNFSALSPIKIYSDYLLNNRGNKPAYMSDPFFEDVSDPRIFADQITAFDKGARRVELDAYLEDNDTDRRAIGRIEKLFENWEKGIIAGSPDDVYDLFHIDAKKRYSKRELFEKQFFVDFGKVWVDWLYESLNKEQFLSEDFFCTNSYNYAVQCLHEGWYENQYYDYLGDSKDKFENWLECAFLSIWKQQILDSIWAENSACGNKNKPSITESDRNELAKRMISNILLHFRKLLVSCDVLPGRNASLFQKDLSPAVRLIQKCIEDYDVNDSSTFELACESMDKILALFIKEIRDYQRIDALPKYIINLELLLRSILIKSFAKVDNKDLYFTELEDYIAYSKPHIFEVAAGALKLNSLQTALLYFEQYCFYRTSSELTRILETYERTVIFPKTETEIILPDCAKIDMRSPINIESRITPSTPGFSMFDRRTLALAYKLLESKIGIEIGCSTTSIVDLVAAYNFLRGDDRFEFPRRTVDKEGYSKGTAWYKMQTFVKAFIRSKGTSSDYGDKNSTELLVAFNVLNMYREKTKLMCGLESTLLRDFRVDTLMHQVRTVFANCILKYNLQEAIVRCVTLVEDCLLRTNKDIYTELDKVAPVSEIKDAFFDESLDFIDDDILFDDATFAYPDEYAIFNELAERYREKTDT